MRALALIVGLLLAGCATFKNTPAQERTWAAIEKCKGLQPPGYQVIRVEPSGRYWANSSTDVAGHGGAQPWQDCIRAGGPR